MIMDRAHRQPMSQVLSLVTLLFLAGCSDAGKPAALLRAYWDAVFAGDIAKVYQSHCLIDQAVKSPDEFNREMELTMSEASLMRVCQADLGLRIDRTLPLGHDTVQFDVTLTIPLGLKDKFKRLLITIQRDSVIDRKGRPPLLLRTGICRVVKEHGQWFIFGDWENRRQREAEQAQQRLDYLPYLRIQNIAIREYQNSQNYLMFKVQNAGPRTITRIRVLLTFLTKQNTTCQVMEEAIEFKPSALKSKERRSVKINITSMPVNWALNVTIKVVDCGFSE